MPTNIYISKGHRGEQNLYEDLIIESLKMYGQDVYYLPRDIVIKDNILNEDIQSSFNDAYAIEVYVEEADGFGGDATFLTKFGLEIRDQCTLIVAKRRWEQLIGKWNNYIDTPRPKEGDIIYVPFSNMMFEIRFVEHEQPFYQLNKLPVYKLQCELFEYRSEQIDTGIPELDVFNYKYGDKIAYRITGGGVGFKAGMKVRQVLDADNNIVVVGEVALFNRNRLNTDMADLYITNIKATNGSNNLFEVGPISDMNETINSWQIEQIYGIKDGDDKFMPDDPFAQNSTFENTAETIIDFNESNPFGEV